MVSTAIDVTSAFKNRDLYDQLSQRLAKLNCFDPLVRAALKISQIPQAHVAKLLELCACHPEGISVAEGYLDQVIDKCGHFMIQNNNNFLEIKYPATTVLLDLTASEQCVHKVASKLSQLGIFSVVLNELSQAM